MSSFAGPEPVSSNPFTRIRLDLRRERAATVPFPPGDTNFSPTRTRRFMRDPLPMLLEAYERYGPVFTQRVFHNNVVFALGPEANHHMLVSNAQNFSWRHGHLGDLMPLLGDGLLTIDGEFHRKSRKIMLPAFHKDRVAAWDEVMQDEVNLALDGWHDAMELDVYEWTRTLALKIAMRALFGLDNSNAPTAGHDFEQALRFWSYEPVMQIVRGPGTPWAKMQAATKRLDTVIFNEIASRRASGARGDDILSLLIDAEDEEGAHLSNQHIRDEVMTLLFAGHDTTTSTIAFMFYELARNPQWRDTDFDLLLDETLRLYPPAWIGPRQSIEPFEVCGVKVPGGVPVNYNSWASHHLPDVWEDPERFDPMRFAPGRRELIPKGAYVPFGGGSRTCIGMRFGQAEINVIGSRISERFTLDLQPGFELKIHQMPTITPRHGMPMKVRARA
jgi:cytochrome P450